MRTLVIVAITAALAGPAYAQALPPMGIPLDPGGKTEKIDPAKENEYRSAIGGITTPKAADPWGSVRETKPASTTPAKKTPPAADKNAAAAKKNANTAKTTDAPKKTN